MLRHRASIIRLAAIHLLVIGLLFGGMALTTPKASALQWHWPFSHKDNKKDTKDKNGGSGGNTGDKSGGSGSSGSGSGSGSGGGGGGSPTVHTTGSQSAISGGSLPTPAADNSTISNILEIVFGIIGAFAVLNITLSGFKYVTSAGDAQKASEAKNGIVYSLIGLAIAISAEAIVAFVVNKASS